MPLARRKRLWRGIVFAFLSTIDLAGMARATPPDVIVGAEFAEPTTRYDHGVLGDAVEWGALVLTVDKCRGCQGKILQRVTIRLPDSRVFEDIEPRIIDGDDGVPLVMVVETDLKNGARLALYDGDGLYAATPFIGRTHRWLAPVGAADLDGDGWPEIAYVDRPHLAKRLRVWRLKDSELTEVASLNGVTNHRIGWGFIPGGIRDCGAGPEMIVADGDWQEVLAIRFDGHTLGRSRLGPYSSPDSLAAAMRCAP